MACCLNKTLTHKNTKLFAYSRTAELHFRELLIPGRNEFHFFSLINTEKKYIFLILGCWLLPEKFTNCPKINLPDQGVAAIEVSVL